MYQNDPSDLTDELRKLRELCRAAEGNPSLQKNLIDSLVRASAEYERQQARRSKFIHVDCLARIGEAIVAIISEEIRGLPGWEDVMDRISSRITGVAYSNTPKEIEDLTGRVK